MPVYSFDWQDASSTNVFYNNSIITFTSICGTSLLCLSTALTGKMPVPRELRLLLLGCILLESYYLVRAQFIN
ncbi:MAG: hypothetical protein F6K47_38665 [Symploca sp. SIO2E6]|nr:hypothetical protein [Symploca sp. SIO2E6]